MNDFFYEPDVKVLMLKGEKGDKGEKGNTIVGIEKTSTSGLVDTYTISFNDGTTSTFAVTNGEKGDKGEKGDTGAQGIQGEKGEKGDKGDTGTGTPTGGKAGQYLKKKTDTDYDFEWSTIASCPFPVGFGGFFHTDPNSIYAGTKWEQKKDVFILAAGDTYKTGSTGGEARHVLTVEEMPNHNHDVRIIYSAGADSVFNWISIPNEKGNPNNMSKVGYTSWVGGSQPHNNMPPFYSMPFWVRTA